MDSSRAVMLRISAGSTGIVSSNDDDSVLIPLSMRVWRRDRYPPVVKGRFRDGQQLAGSARERKARRYPTISVVFRCQSEHVNGLQGYHPGSLSDDCRMIGLRSEEHTSELQSLRHLVCRLLL